jgi:DNA adenine methylase
MSYPESLQAFTERLQGVVLENRDALDLISKMDRAEALHYVDPPYLASVRKVGNGTTPGHRYRHEMTGAGAHEKLAEMLRSLTGMVIVSGYPSKLYDRLYAGWYRVEWTGGQFCSANTQSQTRTECVWLNAAAERARPQRTLDLSL